MPCRRRRLAGRVWGRFEDNRLALALGVDPRVAWPLVVQFGGAT